MLRAIILVVLVGGLLTLMGWAGRSFFSTQEGADVNVTSAPSIQQIREVGELIVLKVPVRDVVTAKVHGLTGGNSLVLIVHGEVGIGVDLTQAEYVEVDHGNRCAVLSVPEPKVMYAKLDHARTRIHSLTRSGMWQLSIGNAGEDQLANEAYEEAQRVLTEAATDLRLTRQAREHVAQVLSQLFVDINWSVQIAR